VSNDAIIRTAAVVAAAALLVAPYRQQIAVWLTQTAEATKSSWPIIGRAIAAALVIAVAWGKVPLPSLPSVTVRPVSVETPSDDMQRLVTPIAKSLSVLSHVDRSLWAHTWSKAAVVVAGDAATSEVVFTDTRALRMFTTLTAEIAWRRIGGHAAGSVRGLREAMEQAYAETLGVDVVPVDRALRERYVEFAKAVAWAGIAGD
jgi:hypothetical protein